MQELADIESVITVKSLLGVIALVVSGQIAMLRYFIKKYITRSDSDHELLHSIDVLQIKKDHEKLNTINAEHKVFHKSETGMNNGG